VRFNYALECCSGVEALRGCHYCLAEGLRNPVMLVSGAISRADINTTNFSLNKRLEYHQLP